MTAAIDQRPRLGGAVGPRSGRCAKFLTGIRSCERRRPENKTSSKREAGQTAWMSCSERHCMSRTDEGVKTGGGLDDYQDAGWRESPAPPLILSQPRPRSPGAGKMDEG